MQLALPLLANEGAFELIRSRRRSISIEVHPGGRVVVRAPLHLPSTQIQAFVQGKWLWVESKLSQLSERSAAQPKPQFVEGERFAYLGNSYALALRERRGPSQIDEGVLLLSVRSNQAAEVRRALLAWYKQQAAALLPERVAMFQQAVGRAPERLSFRHNQRRWGSCNAKSASLNFNILLLMAPLELIDYVVVHELCHLLVPNHSSKFWREVARVMPDHQLRQKALRQLEPQLTL